MFSLSDEFLYNIYFFQHRIKMNVSKKNIHLNYFYYKSRGLSTFLLARTGTEIYTCIVNKFNVFQLLLFYEFTFDQGPVGALGNPGLRGEPGLIGVSDY